ncbi:glycosyltransferase [Anabaena sp. UHCC 0451]|uniref:glycosyltransferase n=1 Tax=Anabaena sp. UHCC 0451 TaxID=2055235 RepID=UPI002B202912|nr:glycosyltransferase [Anabaena sp. UHCC 0451]MEA5579255.1 glycosyltransferase [Anabaena sp. UHCC 0451]
MITVTFGTIPYPFDRAVNWLSILIKKGLINEPLVVQYGKTEIMLLQNYPQITLYSIVTTNEMERLVEKSRLVISHAGQGSTRFLAETKTSFVLIPRLAAYREHVDDHQLWFAQSVEPFGVKHCLSLESLEEAIVNPPLPITKPLFNEPKLSDYLLEKYS